jgi:hypothetical protein
MTTFQTGPVNTMCARNLPQHFNGCTCTPGTGGPTGEVDIDLSEMGSSQADLLMEQIEAVRREAYEAGQRDAFAQMGVTPEPAEVDPATLAPGDKVQCPKCADHPGYGYRISDTLASGSCDACNGMAEQTIPGDDAVECTYCYGSGMTDSTTECPVCRMGKMTPTPSGQDEVFVPGYGTFYRSGDVDGRTVGPGTPYAIRLEANRPLSDGEMQRAAQLLGYNYRATVAGESLGDPHRDSDRSFIVSADTTKSRRDDLGIALEEFEDNLDSTLRDGSPIRTTDRKGPGTKGTRLVDGLADPSLSFTPYYDDC